MTTETDDEQRQSRDRIAKWGPLVLTATRLIFDLVHRLHG